jgi:hypothetical protein
MTSYCDIKDAYSNNDELDKLARDFNNNKKQMVKQVRQDYKKDKQILQNDMENLRKLPGYDFCQQGEKYSQYKEQSIDNSDRLDSPDSDSDFSSYSTGSLNSSDSVDSPDSPDSYDSSDAASQSTGQDYSIDIGRISKVLKNKIKKKKYAFDECMSCESISQDSVSDEDIIDHASKCTKCKHKIMKILHSKKIPKLQKLQKLPKPSASPHGLTEVITKSSISSIKEFIIICVIGLLIIFLLDFVLRSSRSD